MSSTTTQPNTLANELNKADPNTLADAIRQVALGTLLTPQKYDTGVIDATDSITIAEIVAADAARQEIAVPAGAPTKALVVKSLRTVASATHAGPLLVADSGATPFIPAAANGAPGVATLSDDGTTITLPENATHLVIEFVPASNTDPTGDFGEYA